MAAELKGPAKWSQLIADLARAELGFVDYKKQEDRSLLVVALLAMIAEARELRSGIAAPLVPIQVQLWIRELRRLGRVVSEQPSFAWLDEPVAGVTTLPAFHCSECGDSGWLALHDPGDDIRIQARGVAGFRIGGEPKAIYRGWFGRKGQRSQHIVIISPFAAADQAGEEQQSLTLAQDFLCPASLVVRKGDGPCPLTDDGRRFRVKVSRATKTDGKSGAVIGNQVCPSCGAKDAMFIIGSQAATLSSVAIDELFGSVLNSDAKLLAFTDSVQDASHRAGFFSARTFHFTLRTALQHVIDDSPGLALPEVGQRLLEWCGTPGPGRPGSPKQAMAALMPPDLYQYGAYRAFRNDESASDPPA
ncbi:MAG: helicase, partial [Delftia sp.]|nr:helicase [Delftia sp.]